MHSDLTPGSYDLLWMHQMVEFPVYFWLAMYVIVDD